MKKNFFPLSITWLLYLGFLIVLDCIPIALFISFLLETEKNLFFLISMPLILIFLCYETSIMFAAYIIRVRSNSISSNGDKFSKLEKIQYKCSINLSEILNISIVASENNSKNQQIQLRWISSKLPKKYLEFTLIDNKKERICINHYTKKQIIKLLNCLNCNIQNSGNTKLLNIEQIMDDWYSYGGYNREELKIKRGEKVNKSNNSKEDRD